jgi:site-specific DNA-methyltransferase (adenine-specific)
VLRDDGLLFLNIADSHYNHRGNEKVSQKKQSFSNSTGAVVEKSSKRANVIEGLREKSLIGLPYRVSGALMETGWTLRSDIIWAKPNPTPESVKDRPTQSHEHIFMFSKSRLYYYDWYAVMENTIGGNGLRNMRDVWSFQVAHVGNKHYASFPVEIPTKCIAMSTSAYGVCAECGAPYVRTVFRENQRQLHAVETQSKVRGGGGDRSKHSPMPIWTPTGWKKGCTCETNEIVPATVLDPFVGSGTTPVAATTLGRYSIGIDLNESYIEIAKRRLRDVQLPLFKE